MTAGQLPVRDISLDFCELKRRLGGDAESTLERYNAREFFEKISVKYSIGEAELSVKGIAVRIGNVEITSRALSKHLTGYKKCAVLALTLGVDADRIIRRAEAVGQTLGFIADALASVIADSSCQKICDVKVLGEHSSPFAVGYADTDTKNLPSLLKIADPNGSLGITFTDSHLMIPTKSIVVIVGKM